MSSVTQVLGVSGCWDAFQHSSRREIIAGFDFNALKPYPLTSFWILVLTRMGRYLQL